MVYFSKKPIFLALLLLFALPIMLYAKEISAGVLLTYTKPIIDYNNIKIVNGDDEALPAFSGLKLYAGDRIQSGSEEVVIIIPSNSLIIKIGPYSDITFQTEDLGGREYLIQMNASSGFLELEIHQNNDILQILQNISMPSNISREDKTPRAFEKDATVYIQIVDENVEIISKNVGYDSNIFITNTDFDIHTFIDNLRNNSVQRTEVMDLLTIPTENRKAELTQQFSFHTYFQDFVGTQYANGIYKMKIQKEKFFITLQLPLFFPRNGFLYNPPGENDLLFGSTIRDDEFKTLSNAKKIGIVASHAVIDTLKKIETLSYGTEADSFYLYYGEQNEWHNPRATMFAYHYTPIASMQNNFNQDFRMKFNGEHLGNEFRARQFQTTSFTTPVYESVDMLYDRVWWQPANPVSTFEIGITGAADLSVNKVSRDDDDAYLQASTSGGYRMLFGGVDFTIPLVNRKRYMLELVGEGGMLFPLSSRFKRISVKKTSATNFGAKGGFVQTFINNNDNINTGIITNFYYTRGFFKPHYALGGYEYTNKFQYTRSIAAIENENTTALKSARSIFLNYYLFPEIEYFFKADNFKLYIGGYYSIDRNKNKSLDLATKEPLALATASAVFASVEGNINPWIPTQRLEVSFLGKYTAGNIPVDFEEAAFPAMIESLQLDRNLFNANVSFELDERIKVSAGYFTSPQYDSHNTLIFENERSPILGKFPYLSLSLSLSR